MTFSSTPTGGKRSDGGQGLVRVVNRVTDPEISILMPARNASAYIGDAIASVGAHCGLRWELLVVDDHSTDATAATCRAAASRWPEVHVLHNPGRGKVSALNWAFAASRGQLVTTLDSDDCLSPSYWRYLAGRARHWDAMCRDYRIVDEHLKGHRIYHASPRFFSAGFVEVFSRLVSLPRACWTVTRQLAEKIFPIPEELPFEDVWFSLVIKRYAATIEHPSGAMYLYRQHAGQTYGGIMNHRPAVTVFRARRLAGYARLLPGLAWRLGTGPDTLPRTTGLYYETLSRPVLRARDLLRTRLTLKDKASIFLRRRLWPAVSAAKRLQWALAGLRSP